MYEVMVHLWYRIDFEMLYSNLFSFTCLELIYKYYCIKSLDIRL